MHGFSIILQLNAWRKAAYPYPCSKSMTWQPGGGINKCYTYISMCIIVGFRPILLYGGGWRSWTSLRCSNTNSNSNTSTSSDQQRYRVLVTDMNIKSMQHHSSTAGLIISLPWACQKSEWFSLILLIGLGYTMGMAIHWHQSWPHLHDIIKNIISPDHQITYRQNLGLSTAMTNDDISKGDIQKHSRVFEDNANGRIPERSVSGEVWLHALSVTHALIAQCLLAMGQAYWCRPSNNDRQN